MMSPQATRYACDDWNPLSQTPNLAFSSSNEIIFWDLLEGNQNVDFEIFEHKY